MRASVSDPEDLRFKGRRGPNDQSRCPLHRTEKVLDSIPVMLMVHKDENDAITLDDRWHAHR